MRSPSAASRPVRLDEDFAKKVLTVLAQLDEQLRELTSALDSQSDGSPLPLLRADMTQLQRRMLAQDMHRLRDAMRGVLRRHELTPPPCSGNALQACRAILHKAILTVQALAPDHQHDEGRLSEEAEAEIRRSLSHLLQPLDDMERTLGLPHASFENAGADLETLSRIAQAHGLSEIQPALSELVLHEAAPGLVVAALGLANAGKSSMVNRLLQDDLLPVDAIPTGVVPVHIRHGSHSRGMVHLAHADPAVIAPGRMAEFASGRYNPGNERRVERLAFEVPSSLLERGMCLIDSPPWIPGGEPPVCDLGLVLIDSAASLALEEISLVDALRESGSEVIVLLTKADRLTDRERWEILGYVSNRLWTDHDSQPLVFFVSSASKDEDLWNDWIARGLDPCIARRKALRESSLQCKKGRLRAAVIRGLERLAGGMPDSAGDPVMHVRQEGMDLIAAAQRDGADPDAEARRCSAGLIREVAHNAAELACNGSEAVLQIAPMIETSARTRAAAAKQDVERELERLSMQCADLLADIKGPAFDWRPRKMDAAHFDADAIPVVRDLPRPWFAGYGAWILRRYLQWFLHRKRVDAGLDSIFRACLIQIDDWRRSCLEDLSKAFVQECNRRRDQAAEIAADLSRLQADSATDSRSEAGDSTAFLP